MANGRSWIFTYTAHVRHCYRLSYDLNNTAVEWSGRGQWVTQKYVKSKYLNTLPEVYFTHPLSFFQVIFTRVSSCSRVLKLELRALALFPTLHDNAVFSADLHLPGLPPVKFTLLQAMGLHKVQMKKKFLILLCKAPAWVLTAWSQPIKSNAMLV